MYELAKPPKNKKMIWYQCNLISKAYILYVTKMYFQTMETTSLASVITFSKHISLDIYNATSPYKKQMIEYQCNLDIQPNILHVAKLQFKSLVTHYSKLGDQAKLACNAHHVRSTDDSVQIQSGFASLH